MVLTVCSGVTWAADNTAPAVNTLKTSDLESPDTVWRNYSSVTTDAEYGMWADVNGTGVYNIRRWFPPGDMFGTWQIGSISTTGEIALGMRASGPGSVAYNSESITTSGGGSYGIAGTGGASIYNLGSYQDMLGMTWYKAGSISTTGNTSHGMFLSSSGSRGWNPGNITTTGNSSWGMSVSYDGSAAYNYGFLYLGVIPVFTPGTITTSGNGSYGMGAYGVSSAWNPGSISTAGIDAYGMWGSSGSNIYNYFTDTSMGLEVLHAGSISTSGGGSHGMVIDGSGAEARNPGSISTIGAGAHGMLATNGANIYNSAYYSFLGTPVVVTGNILTSGAGSHGMVALSGSSAFNAGSIRTTGTGSFGMNATGAGSSVSNTGNIETTGNNSIGMYAWNGATALNSGDIYTEGASAHGMYATAGSSATNSGNIVTSGDHARGMYAWDNSTIYNYSAETIETWGDGAHGMEADGGSYAYNDGSIITHGTGSYGMYALNVSSADNYGTIETFGAESHGMVASNDSYARNDGSIITSGDGSYGMYAVTISGAGNYGDITTSGDASHGMVAEDYTAAWNLKDITTHGDNAYGMLAYDHSEIYNIVEPETIETFGDRSHGMVADVASYAYNDGSIITHGEYSHGMLAMNGSTVENYAEIATSGDHSIGMYAHHPGSTATNSGSITTKGESAYGMRADETSAIENSESGSILTEGEGAHGMHVVEGSQAINRGVITTLGSGADAVNLEQGTLINSGTLDSALGFAVVASDDSSVTLLDGTVLLRSHTLTGDGTSSLDVYMDDDLAAQVQGFGDMTKRGTGTLLVEEGSSTGDVSNEEGTLEIEEGTQFDVANFTQLGDATLYVHVNPDSSTMESAIPLWVSGGANVDGYMRADMTAATGTGFYNFIRADSYSWLRPETTFENLDPLFLAYGPEWVDGWNSDYHFRILVGYSFSEAALGLVAAVDDWNMLRWIMGNHLQDVNESMEEMETGETKIHAHALGGTTSRDPADSTSAGFDSTQKGLSIGFDRKCDENTVWGLYAGYTEKDIDFTGLPMVLSDWEKQDTWHLGGYISKRWDNWIFSNTLTYRSTDHETFRFQGDGDIKAGFDSWAITDDLRLGYVMKETGEGSNWQIIPEVGLNVGYFDRGGYIEENGFTYGDFDTTVVEGVLGVRFRGEYERSDGSRFVPQARLAWVHVLSGGDVTMGQSWGGTTHWFTETLDDDYLVADLGLTLYNMNNMDISLNYGGRFSDRSTTHGGWLRLEWRF